MRRPRSMPDPLLDTPLFAHCSRKERARLARHVERLTVPAGTRIAAEGTHPHAVYLIVDGHVTFARDGVPYADAGPGEHFGEVSVLSGDALAMTATAGTDVEVIEIGEREFVGAVATMPAMARRLLQDLASGVRPVAVAA